jgi:hypothetical protein
VPRVATAATLVRCQGNACDTRALIRRQFTRGRSAEICVGTTNPA